MRNKWNYYEINEIEVEKLINQFNIDRLLAIVLSNRGITVENADKYIKPTRNDFYDPYQMPDMNKAVGRIVKAIEQKEKVLIYGDYDVDGITSITVLKSFLQDRGVNVSEYIPNRLNEGYGLNNEAIKKISEQNIDLMITVDCGITAVSEIEYAKTLGIETIVTDHHEPAEEVPNAIAVVDCKRVDNKYPFRELAGVGVVFKLCQAIGIKLELPEKEYLKYLDIVAVGTISDIVPLIDENRVITKLGLMLVEQTKNYGLNALINLIGYKKINSTAISFGIAPRINASGRMGDAYEALKLLLSSNEKEADECAAKLSEYNNIRQMYEKNIYQEAVKQIEENKMYNDNCLVVAGDDWHHGVIGIVASKITDLYYKPSILLCLESENEIGKGSGRSIKGFDLHKALMKCKPLINGFGGHSMAIGINIEKNKISELKKELEKIAIEEKISKLYPEIKIDAEINIDTLKKEMVEKLSLIEPIGEANKLPNFAFKNLKIDSIRSLTEGKHIKLSLKSNNNTYINVIGFNLGYLVNEYVIGDKVDIVGNLEINSFNGVDNIQINLKDMMKTV